MNDATTERAERIGRLRDARASWTDVALQVAAFYWRQPWWELTGDQIEEAWNAYNDLPRAQAVE